jgi:hypothetical protein
MTETKEQVKTPAGINKALSGIGDSNTSENTLMDGFMKLICSPVTAGVGGLFIFQLYNKAQAEKEEHDKLKKEHNTLKKEYEELEEEYRKVKKKNKKLKALSEENNNLKGLGFIPPHSLPATTGTAKTYNTLYLD